MPKRTAEEKLLRLQAKIRKLEAKAKRKKQDNGDNENHEDINEDVPATPPLPEPLERPEPAPIQVVVPETTNITDVLLEQPQAESASVSLDPTLLAALGTSTSELPSFGKAIHDSLAVLWSPILRKGVPKEEKERLLKDNLVPENCKLLQAPILNPEISAAISDVVRGRDKKHLSYQQQLGCGTAAVNRAMDLLLLPDDNKIEALKHLSDACRILTDLHFNLTVNRTKLITPSLEKNFLNVINDVDRDEFLFGTSLGEKIKASRAIERQGVFIRKPNTNNLTIVPKAGTSQTGRISVQGNWAGPPRYPGVRGGRGGQRRYITGPTGAPAGARRTAYTNYSTRAPPRSSFTHQQTSRNRVPHH